MYNGSAKESNGRPSIVNILAQSEFGISTESRSINDIEVAIVPDGLVDALKLKEWVIDINYQAEDGFTRLTRDKSKKTKK